MSDKYSYDEFGNQQSGGKQSSNATNVLHNDFGYTGEQWDGEAGLQYLRARYYDPEIGRFINRDSYAGSIINPISQNRYTYVWNNPVNMTDPSGHRPDDMPIADWNKHVLDSNREHNQAVLPPSASNSNNPSTNKCSDESIFVNNMKDMFKTTINTIRAPLYLFAGKTLSALSSFIGGIPGSKIANLASGLLEGADSLGEIINTLKGVESEVGTFGKLALKGVADVFGFLLGAIDFALGIEKMVEAAQTYNDILRVNLAWQGGLETFSGLAAMGSAIAGMLGVAPLAFGLLGVSVLANYAASKYERKIEEYKNTRDYPSYA